MEKIIRKNKTIPLGNAGHGITCNGGGWGEPPEPLWAPSPAAPYLQFPRSQLGFSRSFSLPSWIPCPVLPCSSQMLAEVLGSPSGASWAERVEKRGDGGCRDGSVMPRWAWLSPSPAAPLQAQLT